MGHNFVHFCGLFRQMHMDRTIWKCRRIVAQMCKANRAQGMRRNAMCGVRWQVFQCRKRPVSQRLKTIYVIAKPPLTCAQLSAITTAKLIMHG